MNTPKITNQGIAVFAIAMACIMTFAAFFLSREDHDLKLMSLTAVLSLGSGLMGIAGTLLVGVQAYHSIIGGDVPPGTTASSDTHMTVKTPDPVVK
jgi:hypothetical protein